MPAATIAVNAASVDDDDAMADDDAGTSLDAGVLAACAWRVILADASLVADPATIPVFQAHGHVHGTRAPPCNLAV